MSLLINGMDMPRCCFNCEMYSPMKGCCGITVGCFEYSLERRRVDCPLSEIPTPHGRLIDADVLMDLLEKSVPEENRGHQFYVFRYMLRNAPTIIEAEE